MALNLTPSLRAESLIEALPHIQRFRGHTFVIKYGGSAIEDEDHVASFLRDVVFLEVVGINPILVHGGGKAITTAMRKAGLKSHFLNGLRVTDERSMAIVEETLDREINPQIVAMIERFGGKAHGFSGKNVFQAVRTAPIAGPGGTIQDIGLVGDVIDVQTEEIQKTLKAEMVPVISPIGASKDGTILNINADVAASALAASLKVSKLIFVSDVPGIMRDPSLPESLIPSVGSDKLEALIQEEIISGGMIPKVRSAAQALKNGVSKTHLISGQHCLLLEIFSNSGIGTEILP
ncbi:MAG: acetylglutamate kinase [Verrucomicrobia bacterium]|nr:MAG: acetylglutamate kinase [Verrucomicrobiota bacterium]